MKKKNKISRIDIRLTEDEESKLMDLVEKSGMGNKSEYIRKCILDQERIVVFDSRHDLLNLIRDIYIRIDAFASVDDKIEIRKQISECIANLNNMIRGLR